MHPDADLAVVRSFFDQPIFGQTNPFVALDAHRVGPAYVLAAGGTAQEGWRLEAGIKSFAADGKPMPASIFVTTASGAETAKADATLFNSEDVDVVGDQVVQHGNLAGGFTGVDVTGPDGVVTHADVYAWPQDLLTIADSQAFDNAGGIWLATPPQEGDVTFSRATRRNRPVDSDATPHRSDTSRPRGRPILASSCHGHDLGHDWEIHRTHGVTFVSSSTASRTGGSFTFSVGASVAVDVEGGTYLSASSPERCPPGPSRVDGSRNQAGLIAGRVDARAGAMRQRPSLAGRAAGIRTGVYSGAGELAADVRFVADGAVPGRTVRRRQRWRGLVGHRAPLRPVRAGKGDQARIPPTAERAIASPPGTSSIETVARR